MDHSQPTPTERAADAILGALEDNPVSLREGTDPMLLLYWWKQRHADTGPFMRALEDLSRDGLVTIGPPPARRVRLSTHGFAWLDARTPVDEDADADTEGSSGGEPDADAGSGSSPGPGGAALGHGPVASTARLTAAAPVAERIAAVEKLYATLDLPAGVGIEAGTLLRIWQLDGHPGAELRETLDIMALTKRLRIDRGARTTFALVPGAA